MELVNKGGSMFFVPVSERQNSGINSFGHWEQAFRVFSNIYTKFFPDRASELIQYNHVIFTAAQTFIWENVSLYNREFHIHLSNFPERSWALILQQAWSMCLKDKMKKFPDDQVRMGQSGKNKFKDNCKRFNRGTCTAGASCKYKH